MSARDEFPYNGESFDRAMKEIDRLRAELAAIHAALPDCGTCGGSGGLQVCDNCGGVTSGFCCNCDGNVSALPQPSQQFASGIVKMKDPYAEAARLRAARAEQGEQP